MRPLLRFLARTLLVFLVVEGTCAAISVTASMFRVVRESPRLHTRYDPQLGWASTPGLSLPDHYGPGIGFHTNSRGFRGNKNFEDSPSGRRRIVCSGDSFTLGVGVGDAETWCSQLESLAPDIETINMGQAGYGVDQAYLWFKRDGARLGHRVHVFAFISTDLDRMMTDRFVGFGKPYLDLEGGTLVGHNVPVPRVPYLFPWFTLLAPRLDELHVVALARRLTRGSVTMASPRGPQVPLLELLFAVAEDIRRLNREAGSRVAIVYLPTIGDCTPNFLFDQWRADLQAEFERRGFDYFDLVPDFRAMPRQESERLFLPATVMGRHYSADGHRLVSRVLGERLRPLLEASAGAPAAEQ